MKFSKGHGVDEKAMIRKNDPKRDVARNRKLSPEILRSKHLGVMKRLTGGNSVQSVYSCSHIPQTSI